VADCDWPLFQICISGRGRGRGKGGLENHLAAPAVEEAVVKGKVRKRKSLRFRWKDVLPSPRQRPTFYLLRRT